MKEFLGLWMKEWSHRCLNDDDDVNITGSVELFCETLRLQRLETMATNPLILTLLASAFVIDGRLEKTRAKLYDKITDFALRGWRQTWRFSPDVLKTVFQTVAYQTHRGTSTGLVRETELRAIVRDTMIKIGSNKLRQDPIAAANTLVDQVSVDDFGIFNQRGPAVYSFAHLTFQEFLAARHIVATNDIAALTASATNPRFHEVVLLAFGIMSSERPDQLQPTLEAFLREQDYGIPNRCLLVVQAIPGMTSCAALGPALRTVVEVLLDTYTSRCSGSDLWQYEEVRHLVCNAFDLLKNQLDVQHIVNKELAKAIRDAVSDSWLVLCVVHIGVEAHCLREKPSCCNCGSRSAMELSGGVRGSISGPTPGCGRLRLADSQGSLHPISGCAAERNPG